MNKTLVVEGKGTQILLLPFNVKSFCGEALFINLRVLRLTNLRKKSKNIVLHKVSVFESKHFQAYCTNSCPGFRSNLNTCVLCNKLSQAVADVLLPCKLSLKCTILAFIHHGAKCLFQFSNSYFKVVVNKFLGRKF